MQHPPPTEWIGYFEGKSDAFIKISNGLFVYITKSKSLPDEQTAGPTRPTEWMVTDNNNESRNRFLVDGCNWLYIQPKPKQGKAQIVDDSLGEPDGEPDSSFPAPTEWVGCDTKNTEGTAEIRFFLCGSRALFMRCRFQLDHKIIPSGQKLPLWIFDPTCTSSDFFLFNGYKMHILPRDLPVIEQTTTPNNAPPQHSCLPEDDAPGDFTDEQLGERTAQIFSL